MTSTTLDPKSRITARIPASVQTMLEDAATFLGVTLNSFLVSAAVEKAGDVLAAERVIKLGRNDVEFMERLMDNPPEPNAALKAAAAKHKEMIRA